MKIPNLSLTKFLLVLIALESARHAIQPLETPVGITYLILLLPISTLLLGLTFLIEDKDDDDYSGGLMVPIFTKDRT